MPFPKQAEIEVPLLQALVELGGEGRPRDIYPLVAKRFPQLMPEEQEERLENYLIDVNYSCRSRVASFENATRILHSDRTHAPNLLRSFVRHSPLSLRLC